MVKPVESAMCAVLKGLNLQLLPLGAEACAVHSPRPSFFFPSHLEQLKHILVYFFILSSIKLGVRSSVKPIKVEYPAGKGRSVDLAVKKYRF